MKRRALIPLAMALCLAACNGGSPSLPSCVGMSAPPEDLGRAEHVFILAVDGLRPDLITPEDSPNLHRMVLEGARTLEAQTVWPTLTLPAHTSIVSGVPPESHQVLWNKYKPGRGYVEVTTIFDIAHDAGLKTALFAGKDKLWHLAKPGVVDRGSAVCRDDTEVMEEAVRYVVENRPNLVFIQLGGVDLAGHFHGWMSRGQRRALQEADRAVGLLLDTLVELRLGKTSILIVTADHGGQGHRHRAANPLVTTVPWIVWGGPVVQQELPPVCVTATAPTALRALGLEVPADW